MLEICSVVGKNSVFVSETELIKVDAAVFSRLLEFAELS